jgi:hypothetical protein
VAYVRARRRLNRRHDTKGLRHVHFQWYLGRSTELVIERAKQPWSFTEADEVDSFVLVPLADLQTEEGRKKWKIRDRCYTALDLYFDAVVNKK